MYLLLFCCCQFTIYHSIYFHFHFVVFHVLFCLLFSIFIRIHIVFRGRQLFMWPHLHLCVTHRVSHFTYLFFYFSVYIFFFCFLLRFLSSSSVTNFCIFCHKFVSFYYLMFCAHVLAVFWLCISVSLCY